MTRYGRPSSVRAAVEQARDVRVLEPGEDLPLGAEAPQQSSVSRPRAHELERDALRKSRRRARPGRPSHAAAAELAHDSVRPDAPRLGARLVRPEPCSDEGERECSSSVGLVGGGEQRFLVGVAQRGVPRRAP